MNFYDDEKPIVLRYVDLMRRAEAHRTATLKHGAGWGCCDQWGHLYYTNHNPTRFELCLRCKPLMKWPHRCMWAKARYPARQRYFDVMMAPVLKLAEETHMRTLNDILADLKARQEKNPYQPQGGKLADHRARWKGDASIEYFVEHGMARLNIVVEGRDVLVEEVNQVRGAARATFGASPVERKRAGDNPEKRTDDKSIMRLEWDTAAAVKQAAMVLA